VAKAIVEGVAAGFPERFINWLDFENEGVEFGPRERSQRESQQIAETNMSHNLCQLRSSREEELASSDIDIVSNQNNTLLMGWSGRKEIDK